MFHVVIIIQTRVVEIKCIKMSFVSFGVFGTLVMSGHVWTGWRSDGHVVTPGPVRSDQQVPGEGKPNYRCRATMFAAGCLDGEKFINFRQIGPQLAAVSLAAGYSLVPMLTLMLISVSDEKVEPKENNDVTMELLSWMTGPISPFSAVIPSNSYVSNMNTSMVSTLSLLSRDLTVVNNFRPTRRLIG